MSEITLADLQASVRDRNAFGTLEDYLAIGEAFLHFVERTSPTRIVSPSQPHYIFFQYGESYGHRITRPLNSRMFIESAERFGAAWERWMNFLSDLRKHQEAAAEIAGVRRYLSTNEVNRVIYTVQQAIGSIGDSFDIPNQSRKRVGQLFEQLVRLTLREVGLECESRRIRVPVPGHAGYEMVYDLDLVFSRGKAIVTSETDLIHLNEVVGSVKTTSKDRLDKVFLDKYLLTRFLGREIPVVAIFLHDVQRARRGRSIFGVASTFKSNHFLGYTVALTRLDGVYYVDPRPEMTRARLGEYIGDFQTFLSQDLWSLSSRPAPEIT